jgi:hypothetical protein
MTQNHAMSALGVPGAADASPRSSLQEYLDGAVVGSGQRCFEAGLDPEMRRALREHFPEIPGDAVREQYDAAIAPVQVRLIHIDGTELLIAQEAVEAAYLAWNECTDKAVKGKLRKGLESAKKALAALNKEREQGYAKIEAGPEARWVRECRKSFGPSMQPFIKDGAVSC